MFAAKKKLWIIVGAVLALAVIGGGAGAGRACVPLAESERQGLKKTKPGQGRAVGVRGSSTKDAAEPAPPGRRHRPLGGDAPLGAARGEPQCITTGICASVA